MIRKKLRKIIEQLLLMFCMLKNKKYPAHVSKYNSNREKQVILLMILEGGWHYLAVKELSALSRGITSKHHSDFHCFNCLHSFATENKCESH